MTTFFRLPAVQETLAFLLAAYLRFTLWSIRWQHEDRALAEAVWDAAKQRPGGVLVCFWHGRIALSPACWDLGRAQEPRALISHSPDGAFIAGAVQRLGFPAIRGSSANKKAPDRAKGGSSAFRDVLKWVKGGGGVAITPDGPRGPAEVMAPGVPLLAKVSSVPVLLVGLAVSRPIRLGSWDSAMIPLPFTRGAVCWGQMAPPARDADEAALERTGEDWGATLSALTRRAETMVGAR